MKQRSDKSGFWKSELRSLGLEPKRENELNGRSELENLADIVKQSMYQDYVVSYSDQGDQYQQEAMATLDI